MPGFLGFTESVTTESTAAVSFPTLSLRSGRAEDWTFYKVEHNADTRFSIEYFPIRHRIKIRTGANRYEGRVESLVHLKELLAVMRINVDEIVTHKGLSADVNSVWEKPAYMTSVM